MTPLALLAPTIIGYNMRLNLRRAALQEVWQWHQMESSYLWVPETNLGSFQL